jgi:hypothetical protein
MKLTLPTRGLWPHQTVVVSMGDFGFFTKSIRASVRTALVR